ncbi:hypothetical protein V1504DRAFT_491724 [Lipomyces starkeyi]
MARAQSSPAVEVTARAAKGGYKAMARTQTRVTVAHRFEVQNSVSSKMAWVVDEEASYQRPLNFLKDNEPERRLDIRLSYQSFRALEAQAHRLYGDAKYPRLDYSGTDSRVTIYTIPTALDSVRDGLLRHNKQELLRRINPIGESTISSTDDLGEETYQQLRADINVWLSHIHGRTAILLWFKESPSFRNPTNADPYSVTDSPAFDHAMQQAQRDHSLGPYRYRDHDWCGTVAEAFIEVFNSNSDNEEPMRYVSSKAILSQNGLIVVQDRNLDTGLILGDLFPSDDGVGAAQAEPICLDMAFLKGAIESAARATATTRFHHFLAAN